MKSIPLTQRAINLARGSGSDPVNLKVLAEWREGHTPLENAAAIMALEIAKLRTRLETAKERRRALPVFTALRRELK